jgi:hypothetical protein
VLGVQNGKSKAKGAALVQRRKGANVEGIGARWKARSMSCMAVEQAAREAMTHDARYARGRTKAMSVPQDLHTAVQSGGKTGGPMHKQWKPFGVLDFMGGKQPGSRPAGGMRRT